MCDVVCVYIVYCSMLVRDECLVLLVYMCFFFFQAEDGIRDAQESRGLGDVYKRQLTMVSTVSTRPSMLTVRSSRTARMTTTAMY